LEELYKIYSIGQPSPLAELSVQYADYAYWQRQRLTGEYLARQLSYWKERLEDLSILALPTDHPRPQIQTSKGASQTFILPKPVTGLLQCLGAKENVTLFMILLAVFKILLHRYAGQDDIVIGTPIANRNRREIEGLIGFFVNMLVMRTNVSDDSTFWQLLECVRSVTLEAYAHQDLPFEKLVDELRPERNTSYNPLFQVGITYQSQPNGEMNFSELSLSPFEVEAKTVRFDLELHLTENSGDILGAFMYSTDLFHCSTITRMIGHFQRLIESVVENPDCCISKLSLLTEAECHQLLVEWNGVQSSYPKDQCIHHLFEAHVREAPDSIALVLPSTDSVKAEDYYLSYSELNARSNQLAHYLRKNGVCSEDVIGIMEDRTAEMVISILAVLKSGGSYLPVDIESPPDRIISILRDSKAGMLLTREHIIKDIAFTGFQDLQDVNDKVVVTDTRSQIKDLDSLPFPDRGLVNYTKYDQYIGEGCCNGSISILSTRGCPYKCLYCHRLWPKSHVCRSAQDIFAEVRLHYDRGYRTFSFLDDIFNLNRRNSELFFELVIKNKLDIRLLFPNGLRGDILTSDYIDLMSEAGVIQISLALETASPRLQKLIGKNLDIDKLRESLSYICKNHPILMLF
jgi:hypothetical protein